MAGRCRGGGRETSSGVRSSAGTRGWQRALGVVVETGSCNTFSSCSGGELMEVADGLDVGVGKKRGIKNNFKDNHYLPLNATPFPPTPAVPVIFL